MVIEIEPFEYPELTPLNFCLWACLKSEVYKRNVNKQHDLIARTSDAAAAGIKKLEDQIRRTTRSLRTRVAKCVEIDDGNFEHLL
jgi:hypothetical protein